MQSLVSSIQLQTSNVIFVLDEFKLLIKLERQTIRFVSKREIGRRCVLTYVDFFLGKHVWDIGSLNRGVEETNGNEMIQTKIIYIYI